MSKRRDLVILSLGLAVGAGATSLFWFTDQGHKRFAFDHNLKCQQVAKRFEVESNYRAGVLKVGYSPKRNSCVAEIARTDSNGIDYIVEDLLSGQEMFHKRCKASEILDSHVLEEQETSFISESK